MPVRVVPSGAVIDVIEGETLMAAARRIGYRWPSICGGQGTCTTCFVQIREGRESIVAPERAEESALELIKLRYSDDPSRVRLACQLKIAGPGVVVFRPGVRPQPVNG